MKGGLRVTKEGTKSNNHTEDNTENWRECPEGSKHGVLKPKIASANQGMFGELQANVKEHTTRNLLSNNHTTTWALKNTRKHSQHRGLYSDHMQETHNDETLNFELEDVFLEHGGSSLQISTLHKYHAK